MRHRPDTPRFDPERIERFAAETYGLRGRVRELPSYDDQNFVVEPSDGDAVVLKVARAGETLALLDLQHRALERVARLDPELGVPRLCHALSGEEIVTLRGVDGREHLCRVLTYLPGRLMAEVQPHTEALLTDLGRFMGRLDRALSGLEHPAAQRPFKWDLRRAGELHPLLSELTTTSRREIGEYCFLQFAAHISPILDRLPLCLIHNDGNDYNVLVEQDRPRIAGIIDFGDLVHSIRVGEIAVACAYAMLGKDDPLPAAAHVLRGYHQTHPLDELEVDVVFPLILTRLCTSVCMSAQQSRLEPDNTYLRVTEAPGWELLERLVRLAPSEVGRGFRQVCDMHTPAPGREPRELLELRRRHLGPSLSLAYERPLHIVRGSMQYLFDHEGRGYLDLANNVCHVGHCHPRVVRAAQQQIARLNTNTRYLHEHIVEYARRLTATLPDPLEICFFVCSGSEANELALRMARCRTGVRDVIVIEGGYHGNTGATVEISPYKFFGPGGNGKPDYVRVVPMPDPLRGEFRDATDAGPRYAETIAKEVARGPVAAFLCEPLMGCGGQIVFPDAYLAHAFDAVRAGGGLCIADEVQIGFGRVGACFWGFETQDVVPDIVTLGKPMGNGHPLGAVVTTREIAQSFANGMEYFNTFGGNPVSCAVGLAVLDVIEEEGLRENASDLGTQFLEELKKIGSSHPRVGDVRGMGLFLGVELVQDRDGRLPAPERATRVVEAMKERGFLLGIDGPLHNVIKIKPPLVINAGDVTLFLGAFEQALAAEA